MPIILRWLTNATTTSAANLCWALGGIICNFTPILPYFQHWGDEPRPQFFLGGMSKLSQEQKKGLHEKWNTFFPWIQAETCSQMHNCTSQSNYWRGCRCRPYSNYWGGYIQIFGGIYPFIPPPGFRHPWQQLYCHFLSYPLRFFGTFLPVRQYKKVENPDVDYKYPGTLPERIFWEGKRKLVGAKKIWGGKVTYLGKKSMKFWKNDVRLKLFGGAK